MTSRKRYVELGKVVDDGSLASCEASPTQLFAHFS